MKLFLVFKVLTPFFAMAAMEDENKRAAACCNKRAADRAKELTWLDSAFLVEFEKKLAQDADGLFGFLRGEEDGVVLSLRDYDVSFVVDSEFRPQRWLNGECGVHAFTIQVSVRGGKVVSYVVRGNGPRQVYGRVFSNR